MKIKGFLAISLVLSVTGVVYGAQSEDDHFGLANFNDEMDLLVLEAEAIAMEMERSALAEQAELAQRKRDKIERDKLNKKLLHAVQDVRRGGGTMARVQDLIDRGADVMTTDRLGLIPLHFSVDLVRIPGLVEALIKRRSDSVDYRAKNGWTPLHTAVSAPYGQLRAVTTLLGAGANPNVQDDYGVTPLHMVILSDHKEEIIEALLKAGANPDIPDDRGETARQVISRSCGDEYLLPMLAVEQDKLNKELFLAVIDLRCCCNGTVARVLDLIVRGADVTAQDERDYIPLHVALLDCVIPEEVVAALIDRRPDFINHKAKNGWTPLHIALLNYQSEEIIKALLDAGADPDIPDNVGETPRQIAGRRGIGHWLLAESGQTKP